MTALMDITEQLAQTLLAQNKSVVTAESCTGGGIAYAFTELAGCSAWFERGFVTYSNEAKIKDIGVAASIIEQFGAVSEQTVKAMVIGALKNSLANVAIAVSGIAGPSGGSIEKPVGTVWFAWGSQEEQQTVCHLFSGDRQQVREQAVEFAIRGLSNWLNLTNQA